MKVAKKVSKSKPKLRWRSWQHTDRPILRDRDYDESSGNGLEERRYAQHDANFNTTSITNASGSVQERFLYDSYGTASSMNASWGVVAEITGWKYKFQCAGKDSASCCMIACTDTYAKERKVAREVADFVVSWKFSAADRHQMKAVNAKANEGKWTGVEDDEMSQ